jgi:hypothetical protein
MLLVRLYSALPPLSAAERLHVCAAGGVRGLRSAGAGHTGAAH